MYFPAPLIEGRLIKRYKRFLVDVELGDGTIITAHTANTGAMLGCAEPGSRVWLSRSSNPRRKYVLTWELVEVKTEPSTLLGINTLLSNVLVVEAIENGVITELQGYDSLQREVRFGAENSRIDILLQDHERAPCYVEVKNVTLVQGNTAFFPDAVTKRGSKHLRELAYMVQQGCRALIFYCVQRGDVDEVRPAQHIDAQYAQTLRQVLQQGVETLAYRAEVNLKGVTLNKRVPIIVE